MSDWFAEYQKINAPYKRYTDGPDRGRFTPEFALPEFYYLLHTPWAWTEKVDGTNIRIGASSLFLNAYDETDGRIGGRTERANVPANLIPVLQPIQEKLLVWWEEQGQEGSVILYGEGYGPGIQNGGHYRPDPGFILFDIKIDDWWLQRSNMVDIATELGISVVPRITSMSLWEMMGDVTEFNDIRDSQLGPNARLEGYVGTPTVPLFNRKGERIITKVKVRDFA